MQSVRALGDVHMGTWVRVGGFGLMLAVAVWMFVSAMQVGVSDISKPSTANVAQITFEEQTGVRIVRVAIVANGGIIDLVYQVIDPDKATVVHDAERPPAVIKQQTEQLLDKPFHNHSSVRELRTAVQYHELLSNSGGILHRGDIVTVMIGGATLEDVVVQ